MHTKEKGYIAEVSVMKCLLEQGFQVSIPYGENQRYDLVVEHSGRFWRVQVKYSTPKKGALRVSCQTSNNWSTKKYTSKDIDVLAVYDSSTGSIYFVGSDALKDNTLLLRISPTKNNQDKLINYACEFSRFPYEICPKTT